MVDDWIGGLYSESHVTNSCRFVTTGGGTAVPRGAQTGSGTLQDGTCDGWPVFAGERESEAAEGALPPDALETPEVGFLHSSGQE